MKDFETDQFAVGYSHVLAQNTVIAVDYSRYNGRKGWRTLNINPQLDHALELVHRELELLDAS